MEDIPGRVARLEGVVQDIAGDVQTIGGKVDKLVDALTSTDGRAAERAHSVKLELRDEADRKGKDRNELFRNGLALVGGMAVIVGAICGPYLARLNATAEGQQSDTAAIAIVREAVAKHEAEIARNHDSAEISRDKNHWQDEQLHDLNGRVSRIEGAQAAADRR